MKVLNRGLAVILAGVLILSGGAAFAASPNGNPNAMKMNPARIKSMEMVKKIVSPVVDVVDEVEIGVIPMENGNVARIEGRVILEDDLEYSFFKGNTKIKVKLNNVTANIDAEGYFSQPMPMWKAEVLIIRVYVGKVLVYSQLEDDLDDIRDEIDLQRALDRAEVAISRLPKDLDDLDLDDLKLVERARIAVDILKELINEGTRDEKDLYDDYLDIVEEAEEIMWDIIAELVEWERKPVKVAEDTYYGKLLLDRNISERIVVVVDVDGDDIGLEVLSNGHVWFQTEDDEFDIRVELDGVDIPRLLVEIDE